MIISAAVGAGLFYLGLPKNEVKTKVVTKKVNKIVYVQVEEKFSPEKLKEYILELNLKFPEVIFAQARLESANFTSRAFREQNNMFGLHVAKQRPTLAKKGKGALAHYNSWKDCVVDYAFLVADRMRKIKTRSQYLEYLDKNYDTPGYSKHLIKFI